MTMFVSSILLLLLAVTIPTPTASPTVPAFTYQTPAPAPTPNGVLVRKTAVPMHGVPVDFIDSEAGAEIDVNGNFQGYTNSVGEFTITFPSAGTYTINVGDYPQQTLIVN